MRRSSRRAARSNSRRPSASPPSSSPPSLAELQAATDGFSDARLVGRGGFGHVYKAEALASLRPELRPPALREYLPAVKRAFAGVDLRDLKQEVAILQSAHHAHLLPLFGYCLDAAAPCLIFPLMAGGSLRARMDLGPDDVASLCQMGRFTPDAPPSPLTWRQKLRAVVEAAEALVYLHSCKPQILHRDFKEANILLDGSLHAYLSDTGFAKAAQRGGAAGGATVGMSTTVGGATLGYTAGYADEDVLLGNYGEKSDGFAVGRTLLVVLTNRSAVKIIEGIEKAHDDDDFEEIDPAALGEEGAGWPAEAAAAIRSIYLGLCHHKSKKRPPLNEVLPTLRSLVEAPGGGGGGGDAPPTAAAASSSAALPEPTPLSLQVRAMRRPAADAPALSVQRNVMLAFDDFMRRLDAVYVAQSAAAPPEFVDRISYWRDRCGLAAGVAHKLHQLRIWRNAATHHDAGKWAREGPASEAEAAQLIAECNAAVE